MITTTTNTTTNTVEKPDPEPLGSAKNVSPRHTVPFAAAAAEPQLVVEQQGATAVIVLTEKPIVINHSSFPIDLMAVKK